MVLKISNLDVGFLVHKTESTLKLHRVQLSSVLNTPTS